MPVFENFPYTNFHELNLDWILAKVKELDTSITNFEAFNKLTWKGVHDPGKEYAQWSIVQDADGNGYLAIKAVPANVELTNTDYWEKVADYDSLYSAFGSRIEELETKEASNETAIADVDAALSNFYPKLDKTALFTVSHYGQGFICDGTYFYGGLPTSDNSSGTIYKYDLTGQLVASANSPRAGHYNNAFFKDDKIYFGGGANEYYYGFTTDGLEYTDTLTFPETYRGVSYDQERDMYYAVLNNKNTLVCIDNMLHEVYRVPITPLVGAHFVVQSPTVVQRDVIAITYGTLEGGGGICLCGLDGIVAVTFQDIGTIELEQVSIVNNICYAFDLKSKTFYSFPLAVSTYYNKFPTVNTNYAVNRFRVYHREYEDATQLTTEARTFNIDASQFRFVYYNNIKIVMYRPETHSPYEVTVPLVKRDDNPNNWAIGYPLNWRMISNGGVYGCGLIINPNNNGYSINMNYAAKIAMSIDAGTFSTTDVELQPYVLDIYLER